MNTTADIPTQHGTIRYQHTENGETTITMPYQYYEALHLACAEYRRLYKELLAQTKTNKQP